MSALLASAFVLLSAPSVPPAHDKPILFSGTGNHRRAVTTSSRRARQYFDQGLNFLFAFNHAEAIRSFTEATRLDPQFAMAWWGIAMANGPHINYPMVGVEEARTAVAALAKASALKSRLTPVERALIEAAQARFRSPQPADRRPLDVTYANAMRRNWQRFPKDPDVGALYAEALMDLRPWNQWQKNGQPQPGTVEVTQTLGQVLRQSPNHPLALHLSIHAWEASRTPERAAVAANRLRFLQPGLGHMVHMPSHIDVRLGRWKEAVEANERAIAADTAYRSRRPQQGFYRVYMAHNGHMLGFAAMMTGQSAKSLKAIDGVTQAMPAEWVQQNASFIDGYVAMPLEARVRFGRWDEILAWPELPSYLPLATALRHAARGVAFAAKGQPEQAEAEQALFAKARKVVAPGATFGNSSAQTVLDIAQHILAGEIMLSRHEDESAIAQLRKAVDAEDQLGYDEPPDWILPTRHILGVALLKAGRAQDAERVYREDLQRLPHNGWGLYGLSEALNRQGKEKEAREVRRRFEAVWKDADFQITSSCMCVPEP